MNRGTFVIMPASKRARKIRVSTDFDLARLKNGVLEPTSYGGAYGWDLQSIRDARDQQMLGIFSGPSRLADAMRTDDALFVAFENRLAPQRCLKVSIVPAKGPRGGSIAQEAEALFGENGIAVRPDTMSDIVGTLANHGVAFAHVTWTPRDDGSRWDCEVNAWPIEFVRWDPIGRTFETQVDQTSMAEALASGAKSTSSVPITHGDGRWIVFRKHELSPWKHEACILPAALVWARHAFALRDWSKGSASHGNAKVVGEMPEGVDLQGVDGGMTSEAAAFLELLTSIASQDQPVGIRPAGSKTEFLSNSSGAWQVWNELAANAERAAARIYLGTDGILGAVGGAPGVDVAALFGVATTKVQGDLAALERGILTGVIEPWCAVNFGDSSLAPQRIYVIPDADADAVKANFATRQTAFHADVKAYRENGFDITQNLIDEIAKLHDVPAFALAPVVEPVAAVTEQPAAPTALRAVRR